MNLYRELSCENYQQINQDLLQWVHTLNINTQEFWNPVDIKNLMRSVPLFRSWLHASDLLVESVAVTYGTKLDCCGPHIDTPPARFKLSWPIMNTKGTWNRWFKVKGSMIESHSNHWGGKVFYDRDGLEEIGRKEVVSPLIIDAGIIHDVWFDHICPQWPRVGLQCKLMKEPESL